MITTKDAAKVLDTIMSTPGMNDTVKIDLKISRKNVLLLGSVIERGLTNLEADTDNSLLQNLPKESVTELSQLSAECLQKAGLSEMSQKLKSLNEKV